MRYQDLVKQGLRSPSTVLPENRAEFDAITKRVQARANDPAKLVQRLVEAHAAGEPGLQNQQAVQYMTEEARARSFADQFGIVTTEGAPNQVPYMTFLEPDKVDVYDIALHGRTQNRVRRVQIYTTTDTYTSGGWKEITTPMVEYEADNPFFPEKAAILEVEAMDKAAYALQRQLDTIAWNTVSGALGSFTGKKVWTFRDTDVQDLPTSNNLTAGSTKSFWRNLRDHIFPYFDNQGKGMNVIDVHLRSNDMQYLFQAAPVGATLGGYSSFQERLADGIRDGAELIIYGHRIRLHIENNRVESGYGYCRVGPSFKMWLPLRGSVQNLEPQTPGYRAFRLRAWYVVLQPSLWNSNILKFQWNTSDTNG